MTEGRRTLCPKLTLVCDAGHALAFFSELLSGLNHTGPIKSISLLRKRDQKEY